MGVGQIGNHRPGRITLRRPRGVRDERVDDQAVPILRQHMPEVRQLGFLPRGFLVQARVRIGGRRMRVVRPLFTAEVHRRIAARRIIRRRIRAVLGRKLF